MDIWRTILKEVKYDIIKEVFILLILLYFRAQEFTLLGIRSLKPIGYFKTEIGTDDLKFETCDFVSNSNWLWYKFGTGVFQQRILTIPGIITKLKHKNEFIRFCRFLNVS